MESPDWFATSMALGIPSSLAHETFQRDGIPGLRALCEGWGQHTLTTAAITVTPEKESMDDGESDQ